LSSSFYHLLSRSGDQPLMMGGSLGPPRTLDLIFTSHSFAERRHYINLVIIQAGKERTCRRDSR